MRPFAFSGLCLATFGLLVACGGTPAASGPRSSSPGPATTVGPTAIQQPPGGAGTQTGACTILEPSEIAAAVGYPVAAGVASEGPGSDGFPRDAGCRWDAANGSGASLNMDEMAGDESMELFFQLREAAIETGESIDLDTEISDEFNGFIAGSEELELPTSLYFSFTPGTGFYTDPTCGTPHGMRFQFASTTEPQDQVAAFRALAAALDINYGLRLSLC
jgi:hypothetical protein